MLMQDYVDSIKLELTGGVLKLELPDESIKAVVNKALKELNRYINTTTFMTIPYSRCIDFTGLKLPQKDENGQEIEKPVKVNSVIHVFRTRGYLYSTGSIHSSQVDPMWVAQWNIFNGSGDVYNLQSWLQNYGAWNTMLQIRNTTSTDLSFLYDEIKDRLYINTAFDYPELITIQYIPGIIDVSEIKSEYWMDMLVRLSVALTKQTLGRIRTRFIQNNAILGMDGEKLLEEGNTEIERLREEMKSNSQIECLVD